MINNFERIELLVVYSRSSKSRLAFLVCFSLTVHPHFKKLNFYNIGN